MGPMRTKTLSSITLSIALATAAASSHAQVIIYEDDFSGLPVGEALTNQTWWGPNWNSGDLVTTTVNADGPDGGLAVTRRHEVFAGRFYGGGLRDTLKPAPALPESITAEDVTVSFSIKGSSTGSVGSVGFSVLSFTTTAGANTATGAFYYNIPFVPGEWTRYSVKMSEGTNVGIPGHGSINTAFDFNGLERIQIFVWTRNEFEPGWEIAENESHVWSFSLADISIVADVAAETTWNGYTVDASGWVDTGDFMGALYVEHDPWIWVHSLDQYVYLPQFGESGSWINVVR